MPFAKWNLEPVYVSRTPPWHAHGSGPGKHSNSSGGGGGPPQANGGPGLVKSKTSQTNTVSLPPFVLPLPPTSKTSQQAESVPSGEHLATVNNENTCPKITNGHSTTTPSALPIVKSTLPTALIRFDDSTDGSSEPVLIKIQCRTMVSVIRQMATLLGASDQLFAEITEECRRLLDRSVTLRSRVVKLSGNIDQANLAMRQNPPQIGSLLEEMASFDAYGLPGFLKCHWKSLQPLEGNLFRPETRPLSVRNVYARAHAPGDLRLASNCYAGIGYPSPFVTMLRLRRPQQQQQHLAHLLHQRRSETALQPLSSTIVNCQCHCGRCHASEAATKEPTDLIISCEQHHHNRNSSPSSLVTWSSVASSAFESSTAAAADHQKKSNLKRHSGILSSFSSADYEEASTDPKTKIDDFFRKNNVAIDGSVGQSAKSSVITKCTCSCVSVGRKARLTSDDMTSFTDLYSQVDSQITATTGATSSEGLSSTRNLGPAGSTNTIHGHDSYYNWWWSDDEHRRWSSAMTSPLKPAKTDEMSVWMRENIETRRPESVVFKSASDVPDHILLERALSPPCSMHSIQLRPKKTSGSKSEDDSNTLPRLKRRWSLFPMRRKRHQSTPAATVAPAVTISESSSQFFNRFSRNRQSLPPANRLKKASLERTVSGDDAEELGSPQEVVLMSPEERVKLLAGQYSTPMLVSIDISGKQFNRMSTGRRSLIHSDFHIPRRHIPGRSRSKSPVKVSRHEVSPYALSGKLPDHRRPVAERGCQTEENSQQANGKAAAATSAANSSGRGGRCLVPVEVHRDAHSYTPIHDEFHHFDGATVGDDDEEDYVMLLRKMPNHRPYHDRRYHRKTAAVDDCTTSSNASTSDVGWRSGLVDVPVGEQQLKIGHHDHTGTLDSKTNQTITLRYRAYDPAAKNRRQNGGRSSSGNWSAATSDLIQSSSTSSSPLHIASMKSHPEPPDKNTKKKFSLKALASEESNGKNTESSNNDEAESVYSVDNDGYFTSMHTDSGLFFGHTPQPAEVQKSLTLGARLKKGVFDSKLKRFERIQEEPSSVKNSGNLVESQPEQQQFGGSNESINSILSNSDATSVAIDPDMILSPIDDTASSMADFDCSVSHCSHQFTNGHRAGHSHHLGHRAHHRADLEEKRRLTAAAIRMMHKHHRPLEHTRLRTVSGTYDDDDDETLLRSSSSETLHTVDDDGGTTTNGSTFEATRNRAKKSSSYRSQNYSGNRSATLNTKMADQNNKSATMLRSNSLRRQISNLTESSSASSSCRRLPPPPPPPRVSSMLQTLQKYRSDDERVKSRRAASQVMQSDLDEDLDSIVSGSMRNSVTGKTESMASSLQQYRYQPRPPSESETNSEYLRNQNERRRRLFLDVVDSARSYPPLSYIPSFDQQTDTATSISMASSVFDEDEEVARSLGGLTDSKITKSNDTLCTSATPTAASSRTITPVQVDSDATVEDPTQPNGTNNFGTLERKQLEERHLSSPLPQPKLASFVRIKENSPKGDNSPKLRQKGSPKSQPATPPKPKPRNSLHFTTPPNLESFSKETEVSPPKETAPPTPKSPSGSGKSVTISLPSPRSSPRTPTKRITESTSSSSSAQVSPTSTSNIANRRLTTEDLFIILHNQKKKLNIKTEPTIFTSSRSPPISTGSPTSPQTPPKTTSPQSPVSSSATTATNPTYGQLSPVSPTANFMKRRSWTGNDSTLHSSGKSQPMNGTLASNAPRTRQSLALDRLGPMRPTTLNDFKRLLANVRPTNGTTGATSPSSSATSSVSGTPVSSTYSALQQILKGSQASNGPNTNSTSSGVSSLTSPTSPTSTSLISPLSPLSSSAPSSAISSPFSSPSRKTPITPSPVLSPLSPTAPNHNAASMNSFIKKFSKSKFLNANGADRSRSAVARLDVLTCPPIPEDPDGSSTDSTTDLASHGKKDNCTTAGCKEECDDDLTSASMKHNCTSTWV